MDIDKIQKEVNDFEKIRDRCERCSFSFKKENFCEGKSISTWLYCSKYYSACRSAARNCQAPPEGYQ